MSLLANDIHANPPLSFNDGLQLCTVCPFQKLFIYYRIWPENVQDFSETFILECNNY
uniref:Uncharacterized protein n=1 Tax=Arion vulgaris TaxID=1028688 RepID=A0A0B7BC79_9EUPU